MKKEKWLWLSKMGTFLAGGVCGLLFASCAVQKTITEEGVSLNANRLILSLLILAFSIYIQLILHEAGHLIFGLITGYGFSSFRIGKYMLLKTEQGFSFKKMSLQGTAGQCLMTAPEYKDGKYPYVLYHLGGAIINALSAVIFLSLYFFSNRNGFLSVIFADMGVAGLFLAASNGLPDKNKIIANDGYNAVSLSKSPDALRAMWIQLKVNQLSVQGIRLKDTPSELFDLPQGADMHNTIISSVGVFRENRLMDMENFESAYEEINYLLSDSCSVLGIYENFLLLDRLYIDILRKGEAADISIINDKKMKNFMRSMKNFPSVIRTEYAIAKIVEHDEKKQNELLKRFGECEKSYPSKTDVEAERALIELVG
ncbi:MAG: hypothetical protein ACI4VI_08995 [Acutalibacteraceae bacterium]